MNGHVTATRCDVSKCYNISNAVKTTPHAGETHVTHNMLSIFCFVYDVVFHMEPIGQHQRKRYFGSVRQVAAPGLKFAVCDCLLSYTAGSRILADYISVTHRIKLFD